MLVLYYAPGSASMLVHWLLIELQLEEIVHRGERKRDDRQDGKARGALPSTACSSMGVSFSRTYARLSGESK